MVRGAVAGFLILVLIGFGPGSDIAAHVGGFLAGAVIGLALNAARPAAWQGGWVNVAGALALAALVAMAWRQALAGSWTRAPGRFADLPICHPAPPLWQRDGQLGQSGKSGRSRSCSGCNWWRMTDGIQRANGKLPIAAPDIGLDICSDRNGGSQWRRFPAPIAAWRHQSSAGCQCKCWFERPCARARRWESRRPPATQ